MRITTSVALFFLVFGPLAGCGTSVQDDELAFRYADREPEYLDPGLVTEIAGFRAVTNLFEGLTCYAPDDGPVRPAIATHWDQDDTGTIWTFYLRKDAVWSDGVPVTARDFVYSWRRVVDPETGSKGAQNMWYVRNGRAITSGRLPATDLGVTALSEHKLMVELEEPTQYLLELLALPNFAPVPRHLVEEVGKDWVREEHIVSNGPYLLEEWLPLDHITLRKNATYYDADQVRIERIDAIITEDNSTQYKMYVAGEIDWAHQLPPSYIPYLKRKRDDFHVAPYLGTYYYICNLGSPPLDDPKVRKALNLAIDKESLVRYVTKGQERPATTVVPKMPGYEGPIGEEFDPERARRLLADAGYPNGVGLPEMEVAFNTQGDHKLIAQAIQDMWRRNLNIEVTIQNMEWKVLLKKTHVQDYSIARNAWIGDYRDPMTFLELWYCEASNNHTGYCNPTYDATLNQARAHSDAGERLELLHDAEAILIQDLPFLPIYHYSMPYLLSESIGGFEENVRDIHPVKYLYRKEE